MKINERYCRYFQLSLDNFPTSKVLVIICLIIEQFPIYFLNIGSTNLIRIFFNTNKIDEKVVEDSIYFKLSLLPHIQKIISFYYDGSTHFISFIILMIIFIFIIIFILIVYFKGLEDYIKKITNITKKQTATFILDKILVFMFDILFFRILSFWIIYTCVNHIIISMEFSYQIINIILGIFIGILYGVVSLYYFSHTFLYVCIFKNQRQYPFDEFSSKFEQINIIVKYMLSFSYNSYHFGGQNYMWFFFTALSLFFSVLIFLKIVFSLFTNHSFFIFIRNETINSILLFYIVFQAFNILGHLFFGHLNSTVIIIIFNTSIILFCLPFTLWLLKFNFSKLHFKGDIYNQILFVIEKINTGKQNYIKYFFQNLFLKHFSECQQKTSNCLICNYFIEKNFDFYEIIEIIHKATKKRVKTVFDYIKSQIIHCYLNVNHPEKNKYLLNIFFSKNIDFYIKNHPVLGMNLIYCYLNFLELSQNNIIQVNSIMSLEKNIKYTKDLITNLKDIINNTEEKPDFFIENACTIMKLKKNLKKNTYSQYDNSNSYQIIIIKYIYETLLNRAFKGKSGVIFSINNYEELLQEHFENDKFFLLNYKIQTETFQIMRTGKEYCQLEGNTFNDLFPFQNIAMNNFKEILSKNVSGDSKGSFEYPIQNSKHSEFVTSFKMTYKVYPTINLENILIFCFYQSGFYNIVITAKDKINNKEYIISYNFGLKDYIVLTPDILNLLIFFKHYIPFDAIFREELSKHTLENPMNNTYSKYKLNMKQYFPAIKKEFNFFIQVNTDKDGTKYKSISQLFNTKNPTFQKPLSLYLVSKKTFAYPNTNNYNIIVYSFSQHSHHKLGHTNQKKDLTEEITKTINVYDSVSLIEKNNTGVFSTGLMESASSTTKNLSSSGKGRSTHKQRTITLQNKEKSKKKQIQKFYLFKYFIMIYNVILIVITIVFLIVEIKKNKEFNTSFYFYQLWQQFFRLFMNSNLNLFFLICPAKNNINICELNITQITLNFQKDYNLSSNFRIYEYLRQELEYKIADYQHLLSTIKIHMYNLNEPEILNLFEKEIVSYSFSSIDNTYKVLHTNVSFFEDLLLTFNYLNNIVKFDNFTSIPIQTIPKINGKLDLSYLNVEPGEEIKFDAYSIIINFRLIFSNFLDITSLITNKVLSNISNCKFVGLFFLLLLFSNNLILYIICIYNATIFKGVMIKHCEFLGEMLKNQNLIEFLNEKIKILTTLSSFYLSNANNLVSSYEKKLSQYKMIAKKEKTLEQGELLLPTKKDKEANQKEYKKIIEFPIHIIMRLIFVYIIYSLIFILFFISTTNSYKGLVGTFSKNSNIDANIFSITTILQMMIYTNQTEEELQEFYGKSESTEGYVVSTLKDVFQDLMQVEKDESEYQSSIVQLRKFIDLNCTSFYYQLNDSCINTMKEYYTPQYGVNFTYDALAKICTFYNFMSFKNDKVMVKEAIYRLMKLNNDMIYTFENLYKLNTSKDFTQIYIILLLIYRPIRHYESTNLFLTFIQKLSKSYTIVIYSFLVINSIFEVFVFVLLERTILSRFIFIHKSMTVLEKSLLI